MPFSRISSSPGRDFFSFLRSQESESGFHIDLGLEESELELFDDVVNKGNAHEVESLLEVLRPNLMGSSKLPITFSTLEMRLNAFMAKMRSANQSRQPSLPPTPPPSKVPLSSGGSRRSSIGGGPEVPVGKVVKLPVGRAAVTNTPPPANEYAYYCNSDDNVAEVTFHQHPTFSQDYSDVPLQGVAKGREEPSAGGQIKENERERGDAELELYRERSRNSSIDNSDRGRSALSCPLSRGEEEGFAEERADGERDNFNDDMPFYLSDPTHSNARVHPAVVFVDDKAHSSRTDPPSSGVVMGVPLVTSTRKGHTYCDESYVYNPTDFEDVVGRPDGGVLTNGILHHGAGKTQGSVSHEELYRYSQLKKQAKANTKAASVVPVVEEVDVESEGGGSRGTLYQPQPSGSAFLDFYRGVTTVPSSPDKDEDIMSLISLLPLVSGSDVHFLTTIAAANALFPVPLPGDSMSDNTRIKNPMTDSELYFARIDLTVRMRIIGLIECFFSAMGLETISQGASVVCFEKTDASEFQLRVLSDPALFRNCLRAIHLLSALGQTPTAKGYWDYFAPKLGLPSNTIEEGLYSEEEEPTQPVSRLVKMAKRMARNVTDGSGGVVDSYARRFGKSKQRRKPSTSGTVPETYGSHEEGGGGGNENDLTTSDVGVTYLNTNTNHTNSYYGTDASYHKTAPYQELSTNDYHHQAAFPDEKSLLAKGNDDFDDNPASYFELKDDTHDDHAPQALVSSPLPVAIAEKEREQPKEGVSKSAKLSIVEDKSPVATTSDEHKDTTTTLSDYDSNDNSNNDDDKAATSGSKIEESAKVNSTAEHEVNEDEEAPRGSAYAAGCGYSATSGPDSCDPLPALPSLPSAEKGKADSDFEELDNVN